MLLVQVVADRVLLARLVLLREELRMRAEQQDSQQFWTTAQEATSEEGSTDVASEAASTPATAEPASPQQDDSSSSSGSKFFGFHRSNLPVRCATFMKELLAVPERDRRLGLLSKVSIKYGTTIQCMTTLNVAEGMVLHIRWMLALTLFLQACLVGDIWCNRKQHM